MSRMSLITQYLRVQSSTIKRMLKLCLWEVGWHLVQLLLLLYRDGGRGTEGERDRWKISWQADASISTKAAKAARWTFWSRRKEEEEEEKVRQSHIGSGSVEVCRLSY